MSLAIKLIESLAEGYYEVGDVLQSNVDAQGMKKGKLYTVVDQQSGPFGIVNYKVQSDDEKELWIGNAHLLTKKVK